MHLPPQLPLAYAAAAAEGGVVPGNSLANLASDMGVLASAQGQLLKGTLDKLEMALTPAGIEADFIGALEANAFLAGFANTWFRDRQSRAERWCDSHADLLLAGDETGPLKRQLYGIGDKVDSNWLLNLTAKTGAT